MATPIWQGGAPAVAQVTTILIGGTPAAFQTYAITINGKSVTYTANATDTNVTIAASLQALLAASIMPEFTEISWTTPGDNSISAAAVTPELPFTLTQSASGTGTITLSNTGISAVQTVTITGSPAGGTFTLSYGGDTTGTIAYNAPATGAGSVQTALRALASIGASGVTVTGSSGGPWTVTFASALANMPIVAMAADGSGLTGGSSPGVTVAIVTHGMTGYASASPNDWSTAGNWSTGSVPASSDTPIVDGTISIYYGLDQHSVSLTSLTILASFTGQIGLPRFNPAGYAEYRPLYLQIGATTVTIGQGPGGGSGMIQLDTYTGASTVNVFGMSGSSQTGLEALLLKGTNASNVLYVYGGTTQGSPTAVGIAVLPNETAQWPTISLEGNASVRCGSGVTLGTIANDGGALETHSSITTLTQTGGSTSHYAGAIGTLTVTGGTVTYISSGTIATASIGATGRNAGTLDFTENLLGATVTNCTMTSGSSLLDPSAVVTFSNGIELSGCGLIDVTLNIGTNQTICFNCIGGSGDDFWGDYFG